MNLKEIRQKEQDELKNRRIQHILDCAFSLFSQKGIDSVTMNDIAKESEIGIASLYRYFVTKEELAIQCATQIWQRYAQDWAALFTDQEYIDKSGLEQIVVIFSIFCEMFHSNGDFFRFIYYFDSFIHRSGVLPEELNKYETTIGNAKELVISAIKKGAADGSIRKDLVENDGGEILYYTLTHSLFAMGQKLALSGEMLQMDRDVPGIVQMKLMSQLFINALREEI